MKNFDLNPKLTEFHFGTLSERERLVIERQMLLDPELLVNYFDLKRELEFAPSVPQEPSADLWRRLRAQVRSKPKFFLAISLLTAFASLAVVLVMSARLFPENAASPEMKDKSILFDSKSELSTTAGVL